MRRPRRSRFSIGSAPLTSITEPDAQISGGETRQDYKDTRRFPLAAPSCALLFLPFGLPVSFRCYGRGFSFHAWHSVPGRQFAPSWTVCTNPPFSPTAAPVPVTFNLSPTRKSTTKRHWQQPTVTEHGGFRYWESWSDALTAATLKGQYQVSALRQASYQVKQFPNWLNLRKTASQAVFLFSGQKITTIATGSQEDPLNYRAEH